MKNPAYRNKTNHATDKANSFWINIQVIYCIIYQNEIKLDSLSEAWISYSSWSKYYCSSLPDMHQRYNKWETEHILSSLEQIECLWGVSFGDLVLAPEGGVIAWALVILFFFPIHYKDFSVICDPSPPSSWERRLELDLNTQKCYVVFFSFPFIITSLWPWWKNVICGRDTETFTVLKIIQLNKTAHIIQWQLLELTPELSVFFF